eukprot:CAMPEP_0198294484 /NCGR_PEP_ID=MMETSP1449-20131203/22548_1 /TAXON_ID=420275 /ORGANISM="Attheya septentrionalis, Strain CCMP2084" /LENGTH=496 /DNA_ID=CAMNT_0043994445 /DNA_START=149 /DNA_END=1639 /DNA_ORIENTATION=+
MSAVWQNNGGMGVALATVAVASVVFVQQSRRRRTGKDGALILPHVRSLLPYVGSAIDMGGGINKFIRKHAARLGGQPLFTATILGDKCVFIADPEYLSFIFKSSLQKKLDSETLQKQFMTNVMSASPSEVDEIFDKDTLKKGSSHYHHYLFKGAELERSTRLVQEFFIKLIPTLVSTTDKDAWTRHDLFSMVVSAIFKASMGPLLSGSVVSDEAMQGFRDFDVGVVMMFNEAPSLLYRKSLKARAQLLKEMESSAFWKEASPLMKTRKETLNVSKQSLYKANLGILWASVGNSAPATFWTLLHLIEDETAWKACRDQVETIAANRKDEFFSLDDLDEMTLLHSAFYETLRIYQGNFTARQVKEDFVLDMGSNKKYWIEAGSKLMPFWGILHSDPHIFENPNQFQYDRFVDTAKVFKYKSGKPLTHAPVMAFGGGAHLCPGRKFIAYEVKLFLAMLMINFDMVLVDGERHPNINPAMQGIGVSHPDHDPKIEIRLKQ